MDFPSVPSAEVARGEVPDGLEAALGAPVSRICRGRFDYLVEVESEEAVRGLRPDLTRLAAVETRGVIVTARSADPARDFVSRFFAPRAGVNEDPVTGSAHCALAPYWGERLGKSEMVGHQLSARGGVVHVRLEGDRVLLSGRAVTVLRGRLVA
jgi:PhzF family phenazine biosynthesis protein